MATPDGALWAQRIKHNARGMFSFPVRSTDEETEARREKGATVGPPAGKWQNREALPASCPVLQV